MKDANAISAGVFHVSPLWLRQQYFWGLSVS